MQLIPYLSNMIAYFLYSHGVEDKDKIERARYGFELIISGMIGITLILISGLIFHIFTQSVVFLLVFVTTRLYTGGYHANSYFTCNAAFLFIYALTVSVSLFFASLDGFTFVLNLLIVIFTDLIIAYYSPIENKNKTLSNELKRKNRIISIKISLAFSAADVLLFTFVKGIGVVITFTLFAVAFLMVIVKFNSERKNYYERV